LLLTVQDESRRTKQTATTHVPVRYLVHNKQQYQRMLRVLIEDVAASDALTRTICCTCWNAFMSNCVRVCIESSMAEASKAKGKETFQLYQSFLSSVIRSTG